MQFLVYGLVDPHTNQLRYVGKSCSGLTRPKWHWTASGLKERTKKSAWVKSVIATGIEPEIEVLEVCTNAQDASDQECFWIEYFRFIGCNLTNMTNGGDGCSGRIHSEATKARIGQSQVGKVITPEIRTKISMARGITPDIESSVIDLYSQGDLGAAKIANKLGISKRTVFLIAQRRGLHRDPRWKSVLVEQKRVLARKLRCEGYTLAQIGSQLNVSASRVCVWCK